MAKLLNIDEICRLTGKSRSTIWRWERQSEFPRRIRIGPNSVVWIETEIDDWIQLKSLERPIDDPPEDPEED